MKRIRPCIFAIALFAVSLPSNASSADDPTYEAYPLVPEHAFVPPGFDDNDNSQIVLAGTFPDTCHRMGPTQVLMEKGSREIVVTQVAYKHKGPCLMVLVPYVKAIDFGTLMQGKHNVYFDRGPQQAPIFATAFGVGKSSSSSPDEFLYAPVTDLVVKQNDEKAARSASIDLFLAGEFRLDCMKLGTIRVLKRMKGIVEVLPTVLYQEHSNGRKCGIGHFPFSKQMQISVPWIDHTLIHVRLPDGQSMNRILEIR